jgi:hypothetical protein
MGFNGPDPISFSDIAAWSVLNGTRLKAWELTAIRALDNRMIYGPAKPAVSKSDFFSELKRMAAKNKRRSEKNG